MRTAMPWNDDSWRDSYDEWKLRWPYDEDGYGEEPCDHEDAETDCLDGRVRCDRCGASWYATSEELAAEHRRIAEYAEWETREHRREFWRKLTLSIRWPIFRLLERIWPRKAHKVLDDS